VEIVASKKEKEAERQEAIERLREILPPGSVVTCVLRHVARSGMYRAIDLYVFKCGDEGRIDHLWLSYNVAKALGYRFDERREAVGISGCGMDMGFALVHELSLTLHPESKGGGEERTTSGSFKAANKPTPECYARGYSLKHEWLG